MAGDPREDDQQTERVLIRLVSGTLSQVLGKTGILSVAGLQAAVLPVENLL